MSRLPNVKPREVISALKKVGFIEHHQKGSHLYLRHKQTGKTTCVPVHPGDVDRRLVQAIIKQAGLTRSEFIKLL